MPKRPAEEPPKKSSSSRQEKLAAELRANLKRRKDQVRKRSAPTDKENQPDQNAYQNDKK